MKKIILAVFATMMISPAYADEEIQIAAVMVESADSATNADKMIYAASDNRASGGSRYMSDNSAYEFAVVSGVVVGGVIAAFANDSSSSTSNH